MESQENKNRILSLIALPIHRNCFSGIFIFNVYNWIDVQRGLGHTLVEWKVQFG